MADNRKSFAPSGREVYSTDLMREKLEKWRRMKGRSAVVDASSVYNRSRSAVSLEINGKNKKVKERIIKGSRSSSQLKAQTGYKRINDQSVESGGLGCVKKRRETFVIQGKKTLLINHSPEKVSRTNTALGDAGTKQYRDKTLSMSERLKLWKAEKRKSSQGKPAEKPRQQLTKIKRKSDCKENNKHYQKLENDTRRYCTPANKKQVSRVQMTSTIRKTRFVTPASQKYCTLKSKGVLQSMEKSTVKAVNRREETSVMTGASTGRCEDESSNQKSYKDKTLDMRERLELWRTAKGKTPKYKTPAVAKNPTNLQQQNVQEKKRLSFDCHEESNAEAQAEQSCAISPGQGENIEENLQKCLKQLEKGECELEKVAARLDLYNSACPHTTQIANYWLCRAKIAQQQNDFDQMVCLLEQALVFKAQPESVIKDAVCAFVKFMKENSSQDETLDEICQLPAFPNESKTDEKDVSLEELNSSIIKFCLTEATPYRERFKATFGTSVLTPVRRSVRLERVSTQHPSVLQEHDLTVRKLEELPEDVQNNLLFKPNFAVSAELNEAWTELQLHFNL